MLRMGIKQTIMDKTFYFFQLLVFCFTYLFSIYFMCMGVLVQLYAPYECLVEYWISSKWS